MSTWAEIRRLQAALDEVQSSSTSHKLSERNCIEVVSKLVEMGLLNVLYTMDGKEYVVTSYLETEIRRELEAHGGRVNVVDLQQLLNIDLVHIEKAVDSITATDPELELIQGEVISSQYKKTLCVEVNELLLQNGHVSLADLSTTFGLPLTFITPCIESSLDVLIKGQLDNSGSGLLYTDSYVSRHTARIRGAFSAVTRPTPVGPILLRGNYNENLFHSILRELVDGGQLPGSIHGRSDKATYIPSIYTEMQNQWIDSFLSSNGYLEYDAVSRLGVNDPTKFIKQRYKSHDLVMLSSCCLATSVINEVEGCVQEEVRRADKWVDILPLLPAPCTVADASQLLSGNYGNDPALMVFGSVVSHVKFIRQCQDVFKPLLTERAKKAALTSHAFLRQVSKEKETNISDGGRGQPNKGGAKQKKGKGGRRGGKERVEEGAGPGQWEVKFMSNDEIVRVILDKMEDIAEEFAIELAQVLSRPLQQLFEEEARQLLAEQSEGEGGRQRKRHVALSQQVQELWNRARLFERGALKFEGDTMMQLVKYLLRTLCVDMTNMVVSYIAMDNGVRVPEDTPSLNKDRVKIIKSLPEPVKQLATSVNSCLSGKSCEEFFVTFDKLCSSDSCGLMLKKLDKKKEKLLLQSHLQTLTDSLERETDPAMTLHLTVVILYQQLSSCPLHTPGRLLPSLIPHLRGGLEPEDYTLLIQLQDMVMLQLKTATQDTDKASSLTTSSETSSVTKDTPTDDEDTPTVAEDTPTVVGDTPTVAEDTPTVTNVDKDTPSFTVDTPSVIKDMPLIDQDDESSSVAKQQGTPSPVSTTPSPVGGDWEVVKSVDSGSEASVVRETHPESLKLLEEVLGTNEEGVSDHVTGGVSMEESASGPEGNDPSSVMENVVHSVKELVFKKKMKKT